MSTILQIANADKNLSTMMKGVKAAQMEDTLSGIGPFTILAPVNLAFGKLSPESFESLVKNQNNLKLSDLLSCHVLKGKKMVKDFRNGQKLQTVNDKEVEVTIIDGEVRINGARILAKDRQGSNGVVHSVDCVYSTI
jgi:uncharacterized surface protein with fasciclin (FAS1) repeats